VTLDEIPQERGQSLSLSRAFATTMFLIQLGYRRFHYFYYIREVTTAYKDFILEDATEARQRLVLFSFGFVFFFCALQKRKGMKRITTPQFQV
jgi:hypothetical protein